MCNRDRFRRIWRCGCCADYEVLGRLMHACLTHKLTCKGTYKLPSEASCQSSFDKCSVR